MTLTLTLIFIGEERRGEERRGEERRGERGEERRGEERRGEERRGEERRGEERRGGWGRVGNVFYLMSGTQGVVTQSPEPGAHDARVWQNLKKETIEKAN